MAFRSFVRFPSTAGPLAFVSFAIATGGVAIAIATALVSRPAVEMDFAPDPESTVSGESITRDCAATVDLPLDLSIEAEPLAVPGVPSRARVVVRTLRTAERVEVHLRPSRGAAVDLAPAVEQGPLGAGEERSVELSARLLPNSTGIAVGGVDILVRAWIEGQPLERGLTWSLQSRPPETGRVVARPGKLSVREIALTGVTR